jgi:hypothetical protein
MMKYTSGYYNLLATIIKRSIGNCDVAGEKSNHRYPGCNAAGYYYGIKPPAGSADNFNDREDFAEAVAAYVFPDRAESIVAGTYLFTTYEDNLYYKHYSDTQRYEFIQALLSK